MLWVRALENPIDAEIGPEGEVTAAALEAPDCPETGSLEMREISYPTPGWCVAVVSASVESAIAVLKKVEALTSRLRARTDLIVTQVVPYPLPLDRPPIAPDFLRGRLRVLTGERATGSNVSLLLCRDQVATLTKVLKPYDLVIIGGRMRPWATAEDRLARKLRVAGYNVILLDTR